MEEEIVWVAHLTQLAEGVPVAAQVDVELVVLKHNSTLAVFQGACPHEGTLLAGGVVDNRLLVCSGYGWRFDCASGQKADDPAVCLKRFSTLIDEDRIGVLQARTCGHTCAILADHLKIKAWLIQFVYRIELGYNTAKVFYTLPAQN